LRTQAANQMGEALPTVKSFEAQKPSR
jgi:hypothetical protein